MNYSKKNEQVFVAYRTTEQKSDELCHYGVKGMKWGVRRYQNKDGSLTAAGKKQIRSDLYTNNVAVKYKARRESGHKLREILDEIYEGKSDNYKTSKKEEHKIIKAQKDFHNKNEDYQNTIRNVTNEFLKKYANERVLEVDEQAKRGRKEVDNLLRRSDKDRRIWEENISDVRRFHSYNDEHILQEANYYRDMHKELDGVYKKEYGESVNTSEKTKRSNDNYIKFYKKQVKKNKRNKLY